MSDAIRTSLAAGDLVDRYRIIRQIGAGGMSSVYEAEHVDLGKPVALKALLPHFEGSDEIRARMLREGKAASAIRHPHVVDISDVGDCRGITYLVMELLQGEDLGQRLRSRRALSVEETADILVPVLAGLAAAHAAGVLHRDLKPGNIFITRGPYGEELPKLVDFGIAKNLTLSETKPLTETGRVVGTPYYMSPEQVTASPQLDGRSDVYSMGVILYHCLCGQAPFRGESLYTVMTDVVRGDFETIDEVRPELPRGVRRAVMTAMATSPGERFQTVSQLGLELAAHASTSVKEQWAPIFARASQTPKKAAPVSGAPVSLPAGEPSAEAALQTGRFDHSTAEMPSPPVRSPFAFILAALLILFGGVGAWWFTKSGDGVVRDGKSAAASSAREAARTPAQAASAGADGDADPDVERRTGRPSTTDRDPVPPSEAHLRSKPKPASDLEPSPSKRRPSRRRAPPASGHARTEKVGDAMSGRTHRNEPSDSTDEQTESDSVDGRPEGSKPTKSKVELGTNDAPILN